MIQTIPYSAELDARIRNTGALPAGTGCRYLLCIKGPEDGGGEPTLIAKAWMRVLPRRPLAKHEVVVDFAPGGAVYR